MFKKTKNFFSHKSTLKTLAAILVFLLGIFLRLWKYPYYPFVGHAEEYLFVWSGLSLIEKGVPISWNDLPVYGEKNIYWTGVAPNSGPSQGGIGVRLLKPWLDEPPIFSLIVGGISKLYNLPNFTVISSYVIRIPSLIFSFTVMLFLFLLTRKLFDYQIALISLLFYAITPTFIFGSRLAVPENMITMLMVICLWLMVNYLENSKKWQRNLAVILAVLAGLAKPTGFLLVPFVSFFVFKERRWSEGLKILLTGTILFLGPFLAYGAYFDWELFKKVIAIQGTRPAGWSSLAYIFTNPGFSVEIFLDCLIVLGFFSLIFLIFKKNKTKGEEIIVFSFVYALLVTAISGGKHDQLAWYRYPMYPFMSVTMALLIKEVISFPTFEASALVIPLLIGNIDLLENPFFKFNFILQSTWFRAVFLFLLLPSIFSLVFKHKFWLELSKVSIIFSLAIAILVNFWVVKTRFNILCDHEHCPLPQKIDLFEPIKVNKK